VRLALERDPKSALSQAAEGQNLDVETAADNIHQGARQVRGKQQNR
jgi:hypothetical protein